MKKYTITIETTTKVGVMRNALDVVRKLTCENAEEREWVRTETNRLTKAMNKTIAYAKGAVGKLQLDATKRDLAKLLKDDYKLASIYDVNAILDKEVFLGGKKAASENRNNDNDLNGHEGLAMNILRGKAGIEYATFLKSTLTISATSLLVQAGATKFIAAALTTLWAMNPVVAVCAAALGGASLINGARKLFAPEIKKFLAEHDKHKEYQNAQPISEESAVDIEQFINEWSTPAPGTAATGTPTPRTAATGTPAPAEKTTEEAAPGDTATSSASGSSDSSTIDEIIHKFEGAAPAENATEEDGTPAPDDTATGSAGSSSGSFTIAEIIRNLDEITRKLGESTRTANEETAPKTTEEDGTPAPGDTSENEGKPAGSGAIRKNNPIQVVVQKVDKIVKRGVKKVTQAVTPQFDESTHAGDPNYTRSENINAFIAQLNTVATILLHGTKQVGPNRGHSPEAQEILDDWNKLNEAIPKDLDKNSPLKQLMAIVGTYIKSLQNVATKSKHTDANDQQKINSAKQIAMKTLLGQRKAGVGKFDSELAARAEKVSEIGGE